MKFTDLALDPAILKAVAEQGYDSPSPIQAKAIPAVLNGNDVMAAAQTGTGKTAGFTLPILNQLKSGQHAKPNHVRTLILTPTRELAAQVAESVETYGKYLPLSSTVVFGGVKINPQMMKLRKGCDVLIATPGRLLDLYGQNAVKFSQLEVLVLDEADRMLDMGFIRDIKKIINLLPKQRQNLLFSATFSDDIKSLAKGLVHNPTEISVNPENSTAKTVEQWVHPVDKKQKPKLLTNLIVDNNWQQVLVFTKTKHGANRLTRHLESYGLKAAAIHGNKSQGARTKALANFKSGEINILVATDIAARGLDIDQLPQVVNFELPQVAEDYVHRIGRTGRAGASGKAISLVCADEAKMLFSIERLIQQKIEREIIDGFNPVNEFPASPEIKPLKKKKPKKPKQKSAHLESKAEYQDGQRPNGSQKKVRSQKRGQPSEHKAGQEQTKPRRSRSGKPSGNNRSDSANTSQAKGKQRSGDKPNPYANSMDKPANKKQRGFNNY